MSKRYSCLVSIDVFQPS